MSKEWDFEYIQEQILEELNNYKSNMLKQPIEEVYESSYPITVHEVIADFIYSYGENFEWKWYEKYKDNLLSYLCNKFMNTSYELMNDDLFEFMNDLENEEKRQRSSEIKKDIYQKIYYELTQFKSSYKDINSMQVFDEAEKIVFFDKMYDYIADKEFLYEHICILNKEDCILETLYNYSKSQYYGFEKNNYEKVLQEFIHFKQKEETKEIECEQE